jgi:hypothetical protein
MPSESPSLSAADVLAFLDRRRVADSTAPDTEGLRGLYRQAAAVLAALREPEKIHPVGGPGKTNEGLQLLGSELIPATGRRFEGRVMLRPESRRKAIAEMPSPEQRKKALEANPEERRGPLQQELESYLLGKPTPLDGKEPADLENTLQVALWFEGVLTGVPPADDLRLRVARQNLLAPFEAIAGDAIFRGRQTEMDQLRSYVGVLPPAQLLRRFRDRAFKWLQPDALPALSVSGPGGVGKSALIARFTMAECQRSGTASSYPRLLFTGRSRQKSTH